jgi:glutathione S-transferase
MPYLAIVTVIALLEFFWFGTMVGRARARFNVPAPAMTGNEGFERYFRVHMNTLEQLIAFLPVLWIFGYYVSEIWGAALGVVYIVGRAIYYAAYIKDPKSRSLGFALTVLPIFAMMIGILIWAVNAAVKLAAA